MGRELNAPSPIRLVNVVDRAESFLVHVGVRTASFLHGRDVQDALGTIRTLLISGNADEEDRDEAEQHRDDEGNFDQGQT